MAFRILVVQVIKAIEKCDKLAQSIAAKYANDRPSSEILGDAERLLEELGQLRDIFPNSIERESAGKHAAWLVKNLKNDSKGQSESDVNDLIRLDLPGLRRHIYAWLERPVHIDSELLTQLTPLLENNQLDSVVRKAFILLKERFCNEFGLNQGKDGQELVNEVFGSGSTYFSGMAPKEKQSYRDFFAGLFGLERNRYAHNNVASDITETDAVVSAVNLAMKMLADLSAQQTSQGTT